MDIVLSIADPQDTPLVSIMDYLCNLWRVPVCVVTWLCVASRDRSNDCINFHIRFVFVCLHGDNRRTEMRCFTKLLKKTCKLFASDRQTSPKYNLTKSLWEENAWIPTAACDVCFAIMDFHGPRKPRSFTFVMELVKSASTVHVWVSFVRHPHWRN